MDRLQRIDQLKAEAAAGRERIRQRQQQREADPIAMSDYLRRKQSDIPNGNITVVEREAGALVFKQRDDALVTATTDAENQKGWDLWLRRHLDNERAEVFDIIARQMAEFAYEYLAEKLAPLKTEIADLKRTLVERDERAKALGELKHELAGERVEREALQLSSALAARDARIDALEDKLQILLRFLSLSGLEPPKGVW
jgi:hypothetical protein